MFDDRLAVTSMAAANRGACMDQIASFMGRAGFLPHGYCFN